MTTYKPKDYPCTQGRRADIVSWTGALRSQVKGAFRNSPQFFSKDAPPRNETVLWPRQVHPMSTRELKVTIIPHFERLSGGTFHVEIKK